MIIHFILNQEILQLYHVYATIISIVAFGISPTYSTFFFVCLDDIQASENWIHEKI